jgi:hypothetical protein
MTAEVRFRLLAAVASALSVAPLASFCSGVLMDSKPYKMTFRPLAEALSALGPWLLVVILLSAILVAIVLDSRVLVLSPVLAVVVAAGIALAAVQATFGGVHYGSSDDPVGHDFGIGTVAVDFSALVRQEFLRGLGIAAAGTAVLSILTWRKRRAS